MTPIPCWRSSGKHSIPILLLASLAIAVPVPAGAASAAESCTYTKADDVPTAMRDGTILRSNVFTPTAPGTFPVILLRLPYNKDLAQTYVYASPGFYASHCYIVVVQDVRGQYKSDGFFYTFRYEANDGYDTIEWAATLPKSNGKVGMYGFSYPGWTYEGGALDQSFAEDWPLTTLANSHVRRYPDGAALDAEMNQAVAEEFTKWYWFLPLKDFPPLHPGDPRVAPYFFDWLRHPDNDAYWKQ